jgi:hypothetical protein
MATGKMSNREGTITIPPNAHCADEVLIKAKDLQIGDVVLLKDQIPYEIVHVRRYLPLTHHARTRIEIFGIELASEKKYEYNTSNLDYKFVAPDVEDIDYQVQDIDDEKYLTLLALDGQIRTDVKLNLNYEISHKIEKMFRESQGNLLCH